METQLPRIYMLGQVMPNISVEMNPILSFNKAGL